MYKGKIIHSTKCCALRDVIFGCCCKVLYVYYKYRWENFHVLLDVSKVWQRLSLISVQ